MLLGIFAGFVTAALQSLSYIFSAKFMVKGRNSLQLVYFSQLFMGACCLPLLYWIFPLEVESTGTYFMWLGIWVVVFSLGQWGFFSTLKELEASKVSSLLGLKIIVLSVICVVIMRQSMSLWRWIAAVLSAVAAVGINYSGGHRYTRKAMVFLILTLVFYSLADISETRLVGLIKNENIISRALKTGIICYSVLGAATLLMFKKVSWKLRDFTDSGYFSVCWFFSQISLFVCFGLIGTLFGNVIQSSRGIISIALAAGFAAMGIGTAEPPVSPRQWLRRTVAGILMTIAIIIFAIG